MGRNNLNENKTGKNLKETGVFLVFFLTAVFIHYPFWHQPHFWDALGAYYGVTDNIFHAGLNPILEGNKNIGHPPLIFWVTAFGWRLLEHAAPRPTVF